MSDRLVLVLDPSKLQNPDLDLRYMLPDLISERSGGLLRDDGYDYLAGTKCLTIGLKTDDFDSGVEFVRRFFAHEQLLGNDLRWVSLAVERGGQLIPLDD